MQEAIEKGFEVVLFNRGITNPNLFPQLRTIQGDRLKPEEVKVLLDEHWDVVVDTWQRNPHAVKYTTDLLKEKVKYYAFVSSVAVYGGRNFRKIGITEETPLPDVGELPKDVSGHDYTRSKIHGENIVKNAFPYSHGLFRAHTIFGLDMATGSLKNPSISIAGRAYWPARIDKGGDVLAPGEKTDTNQYTDIKDLARFIVHCLTQHSTGAYNVFNTLTMQEFFEALLKVKSTDTMVNLRWIPANFLFGKGLESFTQIPMWVSHKEVENGFYQIKNEKALNAGMTITPAALTFSETKNAFYKFHSDFDFIQKGPKIAGLESQLLAEFKK